MLIELHVHARPYKHKGMSKAKQIVDIATSMGIGGICFTEHAHTKDNCWTPDMVDEMRMCFPETRFWWGLEITTPELGDVVVFNYESRIPDVHEKCSIYDFQMGVDVINWVHPTVKGRIPTIKQLQIAKTCCTAVEIANKSLNAEDRKNAMDIVFACSLLPVTGSDIHINRHIGRYPCYIPDARKGWDIVDLFKAKNIYPYINS